MDLIDGRMSATAHRRLVRSAAEGNMNMLRVWGGGIWEPRAWFDACDEFGVMLCVDTLITTTVLVSPMPLCPCSLTCDVLWQVPRYAIHLG